MHEKLLNQNINILGEIPFIKIIDFEFINNINEHAICTVVGFISKNDLPIIEKIQYFKKKCDIIDMSISKVVFSGIYKEIIAVQENDLVKVTAKLISATKLLDFEKKSCSFQNIDMFYNTVTSQILANTKNAVCIYNEVSNTPIGEPLLQYNETDWEFIKRIASIKEQSLIVNCELAEPRFYYGVPKSSNVELCLEKYEKEISDKYYSDGGELKGRQKSNYISISFKDRRFLPIGFEVAFNNDTYRVYYQSAEFVKGELIYSYKIGKDGLLTNCLIENNDVSKISLNGKITDVKEEIINVALDIDNNDVKTAGYSFKWQPITGNTFYSMPKNGTMARVKFAKYGAYSYNSPRTNCNTHTEFSVPQKRQYVTEGNKRLHMYPNTLSLVSLPNLKISLERIMLLQSHKSIRIIASGKISINGQSIHLDTPTKIESICTNEKVNPPTGGSTEVLMEYQFDMLGAQGVLCGFEHNEFSPFNDEPAVFDSDGWLLNLAIGVAIVAACVVAAIFTPLTAVFVAAAIGTALVTAAIAIQDCADGEVRGFGEALTQTLFGTVVGAVSGALGLGALAVAPTLGLSGLPAILTTIGSLGVVGTVEGEMMRTAIANTNEHLTDEQKREFIQDPMARATDFGIGAFFGIFDSVKYLDDLKHVDNVVASGDNLDDARHLDNVDDGKSLDNFDKTENILNSELAEDYAFGAIKGRDSADTVVLGRFEAMTDDAGNWILDANGNPIPIDNSYNSIAQDLDAQYFEIDNWNELSSQYPREEIWKINEKFLDIQTSSGRDIVLTHNPSEFRNTDSFYALEIKYLEDNGYRFVQEGDLWNAVR